MLALYLSMMDDEDDKTFFESLYYNYREIMFRAARRILLDDDLAEDAVHDTFLRIMKLLPKLKRLEKEHCKATVILMTRCHAMNVSYKNRNLDVVDFGNAECLKNYSEAQFTDYDTEARALDKLTVEEIIDKIRQMKIDDRDILMLHYVQKMDYKSIAKILDISECNARKRMERAWKRLCLLCGGIYNDEREF